MEAESVEPATDTATGTEADDTTEEVAETTSPLHFEGKNQDQRPENEKRDHENA